MKKKGIYFLVGICSMVFIFTILSCSKDESKLTGKWQTVQRKMNGVIESNLDPCNYNSWKEFNKDGSIIVYEGCQEIELRGTWELNKKVIKISGAGYPFTVNANINELSSDRLIILISIMGFEMEETLQKI